MRSAINIAAAVAFRAAEQKKKREDYEKLRRGVDPTNDRPLSRQQRRALDRRNFPFLTGEQLAVLAAGAQSAETNEDSAQSEGRQSGPKGNAHA